jgi:hypothetical protein
MGGEVKTYTANMKAVKRLFKKDKRLLKFSLPKNKTQK